MEFSDEDKFPFKKSFIEVAHDFPDFTTNALANA
jgi:hypothetical protein